MTLAVVTRGMSPAVTSLARRLADLNCPGCDAGVLLVAGDPSVTGPAPPEPGGHGAVLLRVPANSNIAYKRNRAVEAAAGEIVVFIDDDCQPSDDWLEELLAPLRDPGIDAVMGNVRIPPSTFIGDSISALGFPGGGNAGFDVMFLVDEQGFTDHISTLNCALRKSVFERVGIFDETITAGSDDGELSHRIHAAGLRIKFQPTAMVEHEARTSLRQFTRWFFQRGRGAYQFSQRAPAGPVIGRRLSSYRRIISMNITDPKIVAIVPLLIASVVLQQAGFAWEWMTGRAVRR